MIRNAKILATLVTLVVMGSVVFASSASAHNAHQDHEGACARSTSSISKGVSDLKYNGVLQEFANAVGVHGFNGSLTKQMDEKLVIGTAVHAVAMHNHGCDGSGGVFNAGTRVIEKGEEVALKPPAKYGKEVCSGPGPNCKKVKVKVGTVFPVSCWNKNTGGGEFYIYVRKPKKVEHHHPKKHKPPHKKKPAPECSTKSPNGGGGNCVQQVVTVTPKQECEANNHSTTGCTQTTTTIVANCSNVNYETTGSNVNQGGNCTNGGTETCVGQNNCTNEETCVNNSCIVTPPPEEEHPCDCHPEEPEETKPWVELMNVQEVDVNKSSLMCATVYEGSDVVFHAETGSFKHQVHSEPQYGPEAVCDTYTAGSDAGEDCFWVTFKGKDGKTYSSLENKNPNEQKKCFPVQDPETEHGGWH